MKTLLIVAVVVGVVLWLLSKKAASTAASAGNVMGWGYDTSAQDILYGR